MNRRLYTRYPLAFAIGITTLLIGSVSSEALADELPGVFEETFEKGMDRWEPTDAKAWRIDTLDDSHVFALHQQSKYKPPHRSPANIALISDLVVSDFVLDVDVRTTTRDYGHRDMCLFFGYQDPAHFYYVHLGQKTDDHANQIFIVNDAPRTKISTKTSSGTPWDNDWHHVRIVRQADNGSIKVFWDDMETPVMTATNSVFPSGRIGLGSFDDTGQWDNLRIQGRLVD